jgi:hypothetical protein
MVRFLTGLVFVAVMSSAGAALAKPHEGKEHEGKHASAVPELSGTGAAAGLVLVGGAAAIALGRRRARTS